MPVFTIGHSNRTIETFVALLRDAGADLLLDVRASPGSRYNPQFNGGALKASLATAGIGYRHLPALGGRRGPGPAPSPNGHWPEGAFRNYADHAMTADFAAALAELVQSSAAGSPAVMCAEADWRHCHRRIIADRLVAAGHAVRHIRDVGAIEAAVLDPAAQRRADGTLIYPPRQDELPLFG